MGILLGRAADREPGITTLLARAVDQEPGTTTRPARVAALVAAILLECAAARVAGLAVSVVRWAVGLVKACAREVQVAKGLVVADLDSRCAKVMVLAAARVVACGRVVPEAVDLVEACAKAVALGVDLVEACAKAAVVVEVRKAVVLVAAADHAAAEAKAAVVVDPGVAEVAARVVADGSDRVILSA